MIERDAEPELAPPEHLEELGDAGPEGEGFEELDLNGCNDFECEP